MKKTYLFGLLALALGFTACDDIEDAPGQPQTNPQETIIPADGFEVQTIDLGSAPLDLTQLMVADEPIAIGKVTAIPGEWNDAYTFTPRVYVSATSDFADAAIIDGAYDGGNLTITPSQLQDALFDIYGYNPVLRTPYIRTALYGVNGKSEVRIGGVDVYFTEEQLQAVQAVKVWVDSRYYIVFAGADGRPDLTTAVELEHEGDNQYEQPEFSNLVNIATDNAAWWVVPAATIAGDMDVYFGAYAVKDNDGNETIGLKGDLKEGDATVTGGRFAAASAYRVNVDMIEKTYAITYAYEDIYLVAKQTAWNKRGTKAYQLHQDGAYTHYRGFGVVKSDYRFMTGPEYNKDGCRQIGATPDAKPEYSGLLTMNGTDVDHASGLIYTDADLVAMTYRTVPITSVGIVGKFNDWDIDNYTEMTSTDNLVWTATVNVTVSDLHYKFAFNHKWNFTDFTDEINISLGGDVDDLQYGGADLSFPSTGTYTVTLDLSKYPYTATVR